MTKQPYGEWKPVIGLEIHAQLNTKSKLFSVAPNRFGDEPNINITEVCTGQPGALPVLNKEAVRKAVQFGCAIQATICKFSKFDRKSYFYPDSPRNFQITQFDQPIVKGGRIIAEIGKEEKTFAVNRVHIEDDAGMLKHFTTFAGVDYNRAGVPLIEIVSEPCIHSPQEAVAYAMAVRSILEYIDASDCNMEEGSLRFDANVSVMKHDETKLRNKTEIKNMNSFSNMEAAVEEEIHRQIREYTRNPDRPQHEIVPQATYRWDPDLRTIVLMRGKEDAMDYRYFPEPDLVPIILTDAYIEEIRQALPELPLERERRYVQQLGLAAHYAFTLTSDKKLADYFEEALKHCSNARQVCNWIVVEFGGRVKDSGKSLGDLGITPENVAKLVAMIDQGTITARMAKDIADEMVATPGLSCEEIVNKNPDYRPLNDKNEIQMIVNQVVAENGKSVEDYKAGREKAFAFLVGQVMKQTRGKASPEVVNALLKEIIK